MDTAWIQVFVLTLSECVAPAGKTVCQQQQFELEFVNRRDCEYALQQLIVMKDELDNVIVDHGKSKCAPSARETGTFANLEAIRAANGEDGWRDPEVATEPSAQTASAHQERLSRLKSCEDTRGVAPCKVGEIILEEATGDSVEVWRRDN